MSELATACTGSQKCRDEQRLNRQDRKLETRFCKGVQNVKNSSDMYEGKAFCTKMVLKK